VSITPSTLHKSKPKKKRPPCKLPLKVMKMIDQEIGPLTYQMVLDHGGDLAHWRRWLTYLQRQHKQLGTRESRYRLRFAELDPQGSVALDAHSRRQELESHEYLNRCDPGKADRGRMVAAMNEYGIPSAVTVSRVRVPGNFDHNSYELVEAFSFTSTCPIAQKTLAALNEEFDRTDHLRAEAAIRTMEAYGVNVIRS
jgi:hypothetical protein